MGGGRKGCKWRDDDDGGTRELVVENTCGWRSAQESGYFQNLLPSFVQVYHKFHGFPSSSLSLPLVGTINETKFDVKANSVFRIHLRPILRELVNGKVVFKAHNSLKERNALVKEYR